jgi:tetrahydromethanopterin S-methyltransferase subunit H
MMFVTDVVDTGLHPYAAGAAARARTAIAIKRLMGIDAAGAES